MPTICYVPKRFHKRSLATIALANKVIEEYTEQGFDLTLRQLYYQFVARDLIPNTEREYKRLGSIINDGRLAGLIDWDALVDRTRYVRSLAHWNTPADIIEGAAAQYRVDKWVDQEFRPEVWIEKDALIGVIADVCEDLDVPYFSCRGYVSQSEMWRASQRMGDCSYNKQATYLIHLGDHDPSGVDMTRDIDDRLETFGANVEVKRIALNMEQIEELNPPPNPAKTTDSRAQVYIAEFGPESWELDALDPAMLASLLRQTIESIRDKRKWDKIVKRQEKDRAKLQKIVRELGRPKREKGK